MTMPYSLAFDSPHWLWLLLALPVLWVMSYRSLAGLGRVRRIVALAVRSLVVTLVVCALAEPNLVRKSERMTVIYLVDQSRSVPRTTREAMIDYVKKASSPPFRKPDDRAGLIAFARQAT